MYDMKRIPTQFSYSAAVAAGDFVFLGLHRGFGDTFSKQLEELFESLKRTLDELGLTLESLAKVNVWLKNIEDLPDMEKLFTNYFGKGNFPARMTSMSYPTLS